MRKAYIQPEAELLSLALLEDFLSASTEPSDDDVTVNGGSNGGDGTGNNGATEDWTGGNANTGTGGNQPGSDEWDNDGDWN